MTKRLLIALTSVGLLAGVLAGPTAAAQGGPDRYQAGTTTYTVSSWSEIRRWQGRTTRPAIRRINRHAGVMSALISQVRTRE